jgi:hypothetical protein
MAVEHVEVDDDDFVVDIEDDTPEQDKGKALLPPDQEDLGEVGDDEIENYSKGVQDRIKRLTFEKHDQRRKAEENARQLEEAVRLNKAMRNQLAQFEAFSVDQAKSRVEVELAEARREAAKAFEEGDGAKLAEANERMARLAPQHEQMSRYVPRKEEDLAPSVQVDTNQAREAENRLFKWMGDNTWFQQDETMTKYAHGVHLQLALQNPGDVGTEDYYQQLDREMRKAFPQKFEAKTSRQSTGANVAAVQRSAPAERSGSRKVTLTESQARLAKRLGLTPKQYAEQLIKEGVI